MTIFGFELWRTAETDHIRHGQKRIGDAMHAMADEAFLLVERQRAARENAASGVNLIDVPKTTKGRQPK